VTSSGAVNTASAADPAGTTDPNGANNSATDTDTAAPVADLSVTKTDGQTTAVPGTSDTYTIVDMAFWGWARMAPFVLGEETYAKYTNVKRLVDEVAARPAAARAIALKDKFTFKAEMDDEARHIMFGHLKTKAA